MHAYTVYSNKENSRFLPWVLDSPASEVKQEHNLGSRAAVEYGGQRETEKGRRWRPESKEAVGCRSRSINRPLPVARSWNQREGGWILRFLVKGEQGELYPPSPPSLSSSPHSTAPHRTGLVSHEIIIMFTSIFTITASPKFSGFSLLTASPRFSGLTLLTAALRFSGFKFIDSMTKIQ